MDEPTTGDAERKLAFRALIWRMRVITADADELDDLATELDERAEATFNAKPGNMPPGGNTPKPRGRTQGRATARSTGTTGCGCWRR